jgi:phytoene synthase
MLDPTRLEALLRAAAPASRRVLRTRARTFALASAFLPARVRLEAAVVYAWCRRADDAVDESLDPAAALRGIQADLHAVYAGGRLEDPVLAAFQAVVDEHRIPRAYPDALLEGMASDLGLVRYDRLDDLLEYAYRVAGTVGLMMGHVMGVTDARALRHAAHLGMAMQLTNICRDLAEDWDRGRLYVPRDVLASVGGAWLGAWIGDREGPLPAAAGPALAHAVARLLAAADRYYRSGERGLPALPWRCALAIRAARALYAAIGDEVLRRGPGVRAPRAVVGARRKAWLLVGALAAETRTVTLRMRAGRAPAVLDTVLRYPDVVLA